MCGICGTSWLENEPTLSAMSAALVRRGPDDDGSFLDHTSRVSLAARRLSIIDVPGGHQPIQNETGTVTVVFNGEIYNFQLLRNRLLERGHRFTTQADTEVLVHLYEEYGPDLVHALEGMFAFALWDSERALLVLARDRFGEKPLFYTERDGRLSFASELHALVAGGVCDWDLDPEAIDEYFTFGYIAPPASVVRSVSQLPPGHLLLWYPGTAAEVRQYWMPPRQASTLAGSLDELVDEVEQILSASVRSRLVADVPVGVFLSGGVDSALLTALAARTSSRLKTFTVTYDTGQVGEGAAARRSAELVGADHHELVLTERDLAANAEGYLANLDQPVADEAFVALRAVSEFARREVKVAVGGEGADEIFSGYPRYRWLARSVALERWTPARVRRRAGALAAALPGRGGRLERVLTTAPLADRHLDWVTDGRRRFRHSLYGPRMRQYAERVSAGGTPNGVEAETNGNVEGLLMRLDQEHWLPGDVLAKADRASMQASLELRTPYLHRELVEFAATIPPAEHRGKRLLRRALDRSLLAAIDSRPKTAFRTPTADWLRGVLAPALGRQLAESRLYEDGWFDRGAVRRVVEDHTAGQDRSKVLWPLFVLSTWLDTR